MNKIEIEKLLQRAHAIFECRKNIEREAKKMRAEIKALLKSKKKSSLTQGDYTAEIGQVPKTCIDAKKAKRILSSAMLKKIQSVVLAEYISVTKTEKITKSRKRAA